MIDSNALLVLVALAVGWAFGWSARSLQFWRDEDCCNPNHQVPNRRGPTNE